MDTEEMAEQLCELLSLPAEADPSAIVEATRQLLTARNNVDPAKFVPIALFAQAVGEANRAQSGLSLQAATMAVDAAVQARQMLPFMREWAIDLCTRDKAAFDGFLAKVAPATTKLLHEMAAPFDFSALAEEDRRRGAPVPDDIAGRLGLTADDLKKYGSAKA